MSEPQLKSVIISHLHMMHDDMLHSLQALERLLKLFGEDMSWYEDWRATHEKEKIK
jgi:hypothetical protein